MDKDLESLYAKHDAVTEQIMRRHASTVVVVSSYGISTEGKPVWLDTQFDRNLIDDAAVPVVEPAIARQAQRMVERGVLPERTFWFALTYRADPRRGPVAPSPTRVGSAG